MIYYPKIRNPLYLKYYLKKIQKIKKTNSLEKLINFTLINKNIIDFLFLGKGMIYTKQIKSEIIKLLQILTKKNPKNILEIGTAGGGSLFLFSQVIDREANLISLDLPEPLYGESYPEWKKILYNSFIKSNQNLFLIKASSHNIKTLKRVKKILRGKKLDFLFIDGDHTYKGVKKDFEMYGSLVKQNGIIALHDIVKVPDYDVHVNKFWNEIKKQYKYMEFVEDWNQKMCGIGIIIKNNRIL
jgi:predicted O-methyltransferase YrrM